MYVVMDKPETPAIKLVLIDDDPMVLHSLETTLGTFGFPVTGFRDPKAGLEWIERNGADIVITDICMPGCDGFEVLKRVKQIDPRCDVIFITAHGQLDIAIRALREGAADFFEKPFNASALCAALERTRRFRLVSMQKEILAEQVDLLSGQLASAEIRKVMIGRSPAMQKIASDIVDIAAFNSTVLITGESGTGKELVASAIHFASPRNRKPFLTLNCPSVPEDLFESEMFGHRKGSYTGAVETRAGYVEAAEGGTLFLDEIGDLPMKSQSKILRFLENKTYLPIGEHHERQADVRIIAATNQDLGDLVKQKKFREDLLYRLMVCHISIPPLRERKEDIPMLALFFTLHYAAEMGKNIEGVAEDAMRTLVAYDYPGNVRELRNIIENTVIKCKHDGMIAANDLPDLHTEERPVSSNHTPLSSLPEEALCFENVERSLYQEALRRCGNNVSAAARLLGLSRGKLRRRLAGLGIHA